MSDESKKQAFAQLDEIRDIINKLINKNDEDNNKYEDEESIYDEITSMPLEISFKTDWFDYEQQKMYPSEYYILLCTGGPAVRIIGRINNYGEIITADIEYTDWFEPWEKLNISEEDKDCLMRFARIVIPYVPELEII